MRFAHVIPPGHDEPHLALIRGNDAVLVEELFPGAPRYLEDLIAGGDGLLARVRGTTKHGESARACGVSLRTWMRWWAVLRAIVPAAELPERTSGGTAERATRGAASRRERVRRIAGTSQG